MAADVESQNSPKRSLGKLAVAARVLGKELRRLKLKRMDLRRADLRLGEKAYASGVAEKQTELVSKLDGVTEHITQLQRQEIQAATTLGGKLKAFAIKGAKTVQIAALQRKRRGMLRQLGANLRQSEANSSLAEETQAARAVADRVSSVETEISQLAPQTYFWARRPLLLVCLLLLLAAIGGAFALTHKLTPTLAQRRGGPRRSSLSEPQMKSILAQQQTFQQQLLEMQAEAHRREAEQTQARIAAAERVQREEIERRRAEQERVQREQAERERVAAAERGRQEEQQREEERRIAAAEKARQEQQQREAQAHREKEQEALVRAEQQSKQDARKAAQAFDQALQRNDMASASSLALGSEKELLAAKAQYDLMQAFARLQLALGNRFAGNQATAPFDPDWKKAEEHLDGEKATVSNGPIIFKTQRVGQTWKVDVRGLDAATSPEAVMTSQRLAKDVNEIEANVERGDYKSDKEVQAAIEAKVAAATGSGRASSPAMAQSGNTSVQSSRPRSEDSLAVERYLRSSLAGGMTERQIVELSDLIADKIKKAGFSTKERGYLFRGTGDQRQFNMLALDGLKRGERSPAFTKAAAKQLDRELDEIFPARAVFKRPIWPWKALPPIEEPIHQGHPTPGSLVSEHLETFEGAIHDLAEHAINAERGYSGKTPKGYTEQVKNLQAGDVLRCRYEGEDGDSWSHPYYFWYKEAPSGLDELLKTLPDDHPIRLIGPPRSEAPANLDLAMKANPKTAGAVEERLANKKANLERDLADAALDQPGIDPHIAKFFRPLFHAAADIDHNNRADSERRVKESGGTKKLCPNCNGYKFTARQDYDSTSINPYAWNDPMHDTYEHNRQKRVTVRCDECNGSGVVDAR